MASNRARCFRLVGTIQSCSLTRISHGGCWSRGCHHHLLRLLMHHLSRHLTLHLSRHLTLHFSRHLTLHLAWHLTLHLAWHLTLHLARHLSRHLAWHLACHLAWHLAWHLACHRHLHHYRLSNCVAYSHGNLAHLDLVRRHLAHNGSLSHDHLPT